MKPKEDEGIVPDPIDNLLIRHEKYDLDPAEESVYRKGWWYQLGQPMPPRTDEEGAGLLIVVEAA